MSDSFKIKNRINLSGTSSASTVAGDLRVDSSASNKLKYHNGTTEESILTTDNTETITSKSIDADSNTITNIEDADIKAAAAIDATKIANGSVSNAEFQRLDGVTSAIQTQIDSKITAGAAAIVNADISASAAIDATKIASGAVSNTEFGYLDGVTSALQTQLDGKQPLDSDLTAVAGLSTTGLIARTGSGTAATRTITANSSKIAITNGDGVSGNPTVDVTESNLTISNMGGTLAVGHGGTGQTTLTAHGVLVGNGSSGIAATSAGTSGQPLLSGGASADPSYGTLGVGAGGTGQTSYTDGQLLIGNSTGNTLAKSTLTAGTGISISNGSGSITITNSAANPTWSYVSQSSTLNPAVLGTIYKLSGASFTITLPTAASVSGQSIVFRHEGTSFSQVYTLNTTSAQTMSWQGTAYASGAVALFTQGENFTLTSDGSNWLITDHQCHTGWLSVGSFANYYTYTVSSASATIAAVYTPAYVFTVTAANATVAATYTNNGHTYTVAATISGGTTLVMTGPAAPSASGTLTKSGGTGDATITFSAVTGNDNSTSFTVCKTIASLTTLITQSPSSAPNASGKIVKTSGTGDAVITYSAVGGSASDITATTTSPVYYGTPTNNSIQVMRLGNRAKFWINWYQDTAGAVAGSGDFLFPIKMSGQTFDSTIIPYYSGNSAQANYADTLTNYASLSPASATGACFQSGAAMALPYFITPYDSTHYRITIYEVGAVNGRMIGSTTFGGNTAQTINIQFELPITGWIPG